MMWKTFRNRGRSNVVDFGTAVRRSACAAFLNCLLELVFDTEIIEVTRWSTLVLVFISFDTVTFLQV